jgi:hypothetical protein
MKIKFLTAIAGNADPRYDLDRSWSFFPGEVATVHKELAGHWIKAGIAVPVEDEKKK